MKRKILGCICFTPIVSVFLYGLCKDGILKGIIALVIVVVLIGSMFCGIALLSKED